MNIKDKLIKIQFQIDHLSLRERFSILGSMVLCILALWYFFFYKAQKQTLLEVTNSIQGVTLQINAFNDKRKTIENIAALPEFPWYAHI